ncbi:MAG: hypothetical protein NTY23_11455 [Chloroflexi bacterium]|nr:hypothetical protein [Chloroflexota bacterium]
MKALLETGRQEAYVNCRHENDRESMAMWKLYGLRGCPIAIRSSIGRMKQTIIDVEERVRIGRMRYLDWERVAGGSWTNILVPCLQKDASYEHEHEVRMVIWKSPWDFPFPSFVATPEEGCKAVEAHVRRRMPTGIPLPVDLDALLEEVVVGPAAEEWVADLVKDVMARFQVQKPVRRSELLGEPQP